LFNLWVVEIKRPAERAVKMWGKQENGGEGMWE
jgi:hypothetical protein